MAPLAPPEVQPANDTAGDATAGHGSQAEATVSLLPKGYEKLTTNERSILAKVNDRFIKDLSFRGILQCYVDPQPSKKRCETFRLMDLPTEIRVMIAKYALAYDDGLVWRWIEQPDGKCVGKFCDMNTFIYSDKLGAPIEVLCLTRQLHQETMHLWPKMNELCFDGERYNLSNYQWTSSPLNCAIADFTFYLDHANENITSQLNFTIICSAIDCYPSEALKLLVLTQNMPHLNLRVVDPGWSVVKATKGTAREFVKSGRFVVDFLRRDKFTGIRRTWRVFPKATGKAVEALRSHLSEEDYEFALDCVKNGV